MIQNKFPHSLRRSTSPVCKFDYTSFPYLPGYLPMRHLNVVTPHLPPSAYALKRFTEGESSTVFALSAASVIWIVLWAAVVSDGVDTLRIGSVVRLLGVVVGGP